MSFKLSERSNTVFNHSESCFLLGTERGRAFAETASKSVNASSIYKLVRENAAELSGI